MSGIKGKKREIREERVKKVGLLSGNVIAINPTLKEKKEILGYTLEDDAEETDYTGMSKDGNPFLRVDIHLKEDEGEDIFRLVFFLEDKVRTNKDGDKTQYINNIGICSWASSEDELPAWFAGRPYREAMNGEEDFYKFLRTWLGGLDYRDDETELKLDWKKLMKGNLSMIKSQIGGEFAVTFLSLPIVVTKQVENDETGLEEIKEYQNIYNKDFLPNYCLKHFRVKNYNDELVIASIQAKEMKDMKLHEKFVYNLTGDYGCKDYYELGDLTEYLPENNPAASTDTMLEPEGEDSSDY